VKKKGSAIKYWYKYLAVFSGSYIYFFNVDDATAIQEIVEHLQKGDESFATTELKSTPSKAMNKQMQRQFSTLEYEEYFLIKGCSQVAGFRDYHLEAGEQQTRLSKVRMLNSMNQECVLEFQTAASLRTWKSAVETAANEINHVLGKPAFVLQDSSRAQKQDDPAQVLGHFDIALKKLEIVLEGTSKIKLKSRIVNPSQRDVIVLSAQQPKQFNRDSQEPACLENSWVYALVFQKFSLGYVSRRFDDDKSIAIRSLQIEDKTALVGHKQRFPQLMKSQGKEKGLGVL
jgi:hypothetical protein